jgi:hypothetical protein
MAKLKDVQFSQGIEDNQQDDVMTSVPVMHEAEKPTQHFVIFKLANTKRNGRVHVDGIDDAVMNPRTKKRERIWLLNSADSIWQSDLKDFIKDEHFMRRNRRSILFESGVCRIPAWDERALEFARACRHNIGSKDRRTGSKYEFYEYDPIKQQQEAIQKEYFEIEMALKAKEMPVEKMKKLASFLGVSFNDDLGQYKGDDGIRRELIIRAKRDPINFSKYIDSQEVDISYKVKLAIMDAKIDLTGQYGNAIWAKGGGFIAKIPVGRKAHEYLTELAMTNSEEGKSFKEQLKTIAK